MRERFVFPIIIILGLALYYPVLETGAFILDDGDVMAQAKALAERSVLKSFFYGSGATYYRPVLMLTYLLDLKLWNLRPDLMHLVNLMLHFANSFLVYLNVRVFILRSDNGIKPLPLAAALLFLVHPLATESVNWISGRTDVLAGFFTLLAAWTAMKTIRDNSLPRLWLSSFILIIGSMSKEVGFFVFPALIITFLLIKRSSTAPSFFLTWPWRLKAILPFVVGGIIYFFMRSARFDHVDKGVATVTNSETYHDPMKLTQLVTDIGFYIKKLLIPQPLSLAIDQVSPDYLWLGILALLLFLLLICLRNLLSGIALLIALTIFPALLNALLHIAWTPYAERYLYIPAAFLCIGLCLPILGPGNTTLRITRIIALAVLFCSFLPTTLVRNHLWAEPLELTRLTYQQNPDNPTVWGMYAVMLANQKFYDRARVEFHRALSQHPDHLYLHESLAAMELYVDDPEASRKALEKFFSNDLKPNRKILELMLECNQKRLISSYPVETAQTIRRELITTYQTLYDQDTRASDLLKATDLLIQNRDYETARASLMTLQAQHNLSEKITREVSSRINLLPSE